MHNVPTAADFLQHRVAMLSRELAESQAQVAGLRATMEEMIPRPKDTPAMGKVLDFPTLVPPVDQHEGDR